MTVTSLAQDVSIQLDGVSVRYRAPNERTSTFKEYIIRRLQGRIKNLYFWALRDVSFTVRQGEVFGVIGQNGAGKSTILKVIARVLRPTQGRVRVRGRVAPLLELGAGFHPELSGRENIILNGAMFGFTRSQMEKKVDRIIDFSEMHNFIDAPMRTYSSGMWARLGFAVATDVDPDILILDEVLAVGDEAFQRKCVERIEGFREAGTTILLVSHNTAMVESMCQRAAWLDHGTAKCVGDVNEVVHAYRESQRPS
ncbi:MAG TPA: ABC transporter ATP-binding protein [Anaerolinea sp.]|nr:ABC transporter ATP-binding protein [Anaerolinea sp.]